MIQTYFKNLNALQAIEYILLMVLAFAIPISWQIAVKVTALLAIIIPIRIFAQKKIRISITKKQKFFILFMATYVIYAISMLYTSNIAEGWLNMEKKY